MASEVDICNLALSRIGDDATVSSINPPEGSAQADHCATFYPIARDSMLEMHNWKFATTRVALAPLSVATPNQWLYVYAAPSDCVRAVAVYPPNTPVSPSVSYSTSLSSSVDLDSYNLFDIDYIYDEQEFITETLSDGTQIIYTNQQNAVLLYTRVITDTAKFTPLFIDALAWLLASYLAGPIIKGSAGIKVGASMAQFAQAVLSSAKMSDANQSMKKNLDTQHKASWMRCR